MQTLSLRCLLAARSAADLFLVQFPGRAALLTVYKGSFSNRRSFASFNSSRSFFRSTNTALSLSSSSLFTRIATRTHFTHSCSRNLKFDMSPMYVSAIFSFFSYFLLFLVGLSAFATGDISKTTIASINHNLLSTSSIRYHHSSHPIPVSLPSFSYYDCPTQFACS